jgi:hypothetical protein
VTAAEAIRAYVARCAAADRLLTQAGSTRLRDRERAEYREAAAVQARLADAAARIAAALITTEQEGRTS